MFSTPPDPLPLVISIQSQVAFGHVGNSAAAYPMRACGVEVVEVPTALLSNHPHYSTVHGEILDANLVSNLLKGLGKRGLLERVTVILSGFLGRTETAHAVAEFVRRAKRVNPDVIYACDPVMGDTDLGYFVDERLQDAFARDLVPLADIILPNAFELAALSGVPVACADDVAIARAALNCPAVVATSVPVPDRPDHLATVTATKASLCTIEVARLPVRPAGTGDLLAGLTVARVALGLDIDAAVSRAVAGVNAVLSQTSSEPWAEMPIAAALDAIISAGQAEIS